MGMLDDAIREHLELKKRSGASEDEVKRLESEAFGPVRREPVATAPPPAAEEEPEAEAAVPESPPAAEPVAEPPPPPADPVADSQARSWLEDEHDESTGEFTAAEAAEATGRQPADYVAPDEEGDDLLEETPDFLQETPEHDRLWFEQRPPRDFDFDE